MELGQDSDPCVGFQLPSLISLVLGHVGLSRHIVWESLDDSACWVMPLGDTQGCIMKCSSFPL